MIKEQELIDELQEYLDIEDTSRIDLYPEDVQMCIDALEKQIAKKPKNIMAYVSPFEVKDKYALCPICNMEVVESINWCPFCGQKLDWNE